jgi:hypothetical protein
MKEKKIRIKTVGADSHTAYVELPGHPRTLTPGCVKRTIGLDDLIENFKGPRVHLDFDANDRLIGIEILVFDSDIPPDAKP